MGGGSSSRWPTVEKRVREGRGQGTGADYIPWFHIRDISSAGKSHRIKSWKSGRTLQLFSDLELHLAYLLDWSASVTDFYEQYPLLPLDETLHIGEEIGYSHPIDKKTKEPRVRTTDFLIELTMDGTSRQVARAVKPSIDLSSKAVVQSLEVERRFWAARGIEWGIVTERDMSPVVIKNIEFLHDARTMEDHEDIAQLPLAEILPALRNAIDAQDRPLAHACLEVDRSLGLSHGTGLFLLRYQLANKGWQVDMREPIDTSRPLRLLHLDADSVSDSLRKAI